MGLLLGRGTAGRVDVQAELLELLPTKALADCLSVCGLAPSLMQRLTVELPDVHKALTTPSLPPRKHNATHCKEKLVAKLAIQVREARDNLLALASSSDMSAENISTQPLVATASSGATSSDCSGSQRL